MYSERVKRLEKLFEEEVPALVKSWYYEFADKYPNRYMPLSMINKGSQSISIFQFINEFISDNYYIPFEISKYFEFHNASLFYAPTDDFGFSMKIKSKNEIPSDLLNEYISRAGYVYEFGIFSHAFLGISGLSNVVKKKIKDDIEVECELIKFRIKSYFKRFFIQGGFDWSWIVADQICHYGIDKFPNCLDHDFGQLEFSMEFFEKNGHLGEMDDIPYVDHESYKREQEFYKELAKKKVSEYTYIDVLKEHLIFKDRIKGEIVYANCQELGKVPLLELKKCGHLLKKDRNYKENYFNYLNYRKDNAGTELFPLSPCINFKLDITDVLKDDELVQEYLETYNEPENEIRNIFGLPKIGEGWISETNLYYEIKTHFANEIVMHHGRPNWLGKQHLDIYLPKYNIGIEYQGDQHYFPVEFFGGEESFAKNKLRDAKKKELCEKNNCHLIYVNPGYGLEELIEQIRKLVK